MEAGALRRLGCGDDVMMWQLVNVYKHVCLCAKHAGTGKFIKNVVY
jgi:hypothetical protein